MEDLSVYKIFPTKLSDTIYNSLYLGCYKYREDYTTYNDSVYIPTENDFTYNRTNYNSNADMPYNKVFEYNYNLYLTDGVLIQIYNATSKAFEVLFNYADYYTNPSAFSNYSGLIGGVWFYNGKFISSFLCSINGIRKNVLAVYDIATQTYTEVDKGFNSLNASTSLQSQFSCIYDGKIYYYKRTYETSGYNTSICTYGLTTGTKTTNNIVFDFEQPYKEQSLFYFHPTNNNLFATIKEKNLNGDYCFYLLKLIDGILTQVKEISVNVYNYYTSIDSYTFDSNYIYLQQVTVNRNPRNKKILRYDITNDVLTTIFNVDQDIYTDVFYYPFVMNDKLYLTTGNGSQVYYWGNNQFNLIDDFQLKYFLYDVYNFPVFYKNNNLYFNQDEESYYLTKFQIYKNYLVMQGFYNDVLSLIFYNQTTNTIVNSYPIPEEITNINVIKVYKETDTGTEKLLLGVLTKGLWILRDSDEENIYFERVF